MNAPDKAINQILGELAKAVQKFPQWPQDPVHAAGIVSEEAGELMQAVLDSIYQPDKENKGDVELEAMQTAVTAIRFIMGMRGYRWLQSEWQGAESSEATGFVKELAGAEENQRPVVGRSVLGDYAGSSWKPSSADDAESFQRQYCDRCEYGRTRRCRIAIDSLFWETTDSDFPKSWVIGEDLLATCNSFIQRNRGA